MGLFGRDDRPTPSHPPTPATPTARPSSAPRPQAGARADEVTVIARATRVEGTIHASNDVQIEGQLNGAFDGSSQLTVVEGATVEAALHSRVVVVAGSLTGDVTADERIELRPSAKLRGNITAPRIVIQDGATFEGQVFMQKPEAKAKPSAPAPPAGSMSPAAAKPPVGGAPPAALKPEVKPAPSQGDDPNRGPQNHRR